MNSSLDRVYLGAFKTNLAACFCSLIKVFWSLSALLCDFRETASFGMGCSVISSDRHTSQTICTDAAGNSLPGVNKLFFILYRDLADDQLHVDNQASNSSASY